MFGFYAFWLPWLKVSIIPWWHLLQLVPDSQKGNAAPIGMAWMAKHEEVLKDLKHEVLSKPILQCTDFSHCFYLKTDWSSKGMGTVQIQVVDNDDVADDAEVAEYEGEPCQFDTTINALRLHPVACLSRKCLPQEALYHSYMGKAATGIWVIEKFCQYLYGKEFTWITNCSGL